MIRFLAIATFSVVFTLVTAHPALAGNVDRYERVELSPIKSKGEVVGMRVKMTLRKELEYTRVRVGLVPADKRQLNSSGETWRTAAQNPKAGYLIHQFPEVDFSQVPKGGALEVKFDLRYKDTPGLKPGQSFELVAAFNGRKDFPNHWHVFGMTSPLNSQATAYTLPGAPAALRSRVSQSSRPSRSAAHRNQRAPARKPTGRTARARGR